MTRQRTAFWIIVLYVITGLPFGIIYETIPVYLRMRGLSHEHIGLLNLVQLAWTFKVLWGPMVERFGTPRNWIVSCLFVLGCVHLGFAFSDAYQTPTFVFAMLLWALAVASATQDMAIDGLFIRMTRHEEDEGLSNGLRVSAYRISMVLGSGGAIMLANWLHWQWIFGVCGLTFFICLALMFLGPQAAKQRPTGLPWKQWRQVLLSWFRLPGSWGTMLFILLYRTGDAAVAAMSKAFWVDQGVEPLAIGFVNSTVGMFATVVGALGGGWYTSRYGIFRALWVLGTLQAMGSLAYALVAMGDNSHSSLYLASTIEHFTHGLGTAALMTFLTHLCDPTAAATQFAALTAAMATMRAIAGAGSGFVVGALGFTWFFVLAFVAAFPAYACLPWVKQRLRAQDRQPLRL